MTADDRNIESPPIIHSTSFSEIAPKTEIADSNMSFVLPPSSPNFEETPSTTTAEAMPPRSTCPDFNQIRMRSALDSSSIKSLVCLKKNKAVNFGHMGIITKITGKTKNRRYHVSFRNGKRGFYCKEELQIIGSPVLEDHDLFSTCVKSMSGFSAQVRVGVLIDEAAYLLSRQSSQEIWTAIPYPTSEGRFTRRYNRVELRTAIDRSQMKWFRPQPGSECEEHETSVILNDDRLTTSDSVDYESDNWDPSEALSENEMKSDGSVVNADVSTEPLTNEGIIKRFRGILLQWPRQYNGRIAGKKYGTRSSTPGSGWLFMNNDDALAINGGSTSGLSVDHYRSPPGVGIFDPILQYSSHFPNIKDLKCPLCGEVGKIWSKGK